MTFTPGGLAGIDALVADAVASGQAPGVVTAVAHGDSMHVATAGVMAVDGPAMRRDTIFRIASMTKPMTAVAVLCLVADGVIELDEPVDRLLPELADRRVLRRPDGPLDDTVPAVRPPTVRDLLTFTWGFGMQGAMFMAQPAWPIHTATDELDMHTFGAPRPDLTPPSDEWLARLGGLPLVVQPGERWLYQTGSQVLGVLAARAAGAPFEDLLRVRLFEPLTMTDTGFWTPATDRLATAYARHDGALVVADEPSGAWSRPPAFADGGGGLLSTADDVVRFGRMLARGGDPVLPTELVAEMVRDQLTADQRVAWPGGFDLLSGRGWGFGVSVFEDGRYSWDGGFGTAWSNLPAHDLTVVTLTQRAIDETGAPAVCEDAVAAAVAAVA